MSAWFRPASREPELKIGPVTAASYLATGEATGGKFGLYRWDMAPGVPGAASHFHRTISESFFVLSGNPAFFNGEDWIEAAPGDYLYVPEGGLHGFRNTSSEPASMLILFAPGAPREAYFEGLTDRALAAASLRRSSSKSSATRTTITSCNDHCCIGAQHTPLTLCPFTEQQPSSRLG